MPLEISEASDRHARPGDLAAGVVNGRLALPRDVAVALRSEGVRTAEDLLSYIEAFPGGLAKMLHWNAKDARTAAGKLKAALKGIVRDEFFQPTVPSRRVFGALDPKTLDAKRFGLFRR